MTDRYKGFLVTLEKEISENNAENIINALRMVKGVHSVKPYITGIEDYMAYEKAKSEIGSKVLEFVTKELFGIKDK